MLERQETTSAAWEDNDPETRGADTTLWQHMLAGSCAGVVEHACVFPIDTVKTHVQAARSSASGAAASSVAIARELVAARNGGVARLWRGVGVLLHAVVPAHALMFASYEAVLHAGGAHGVAHAQSASAERVAAVGFVAGAVSTCFHDSIMVPAETVKQRLQLGCARARLPAQIGRAIPPPPRERSSRSPSSITFACAGTIATARTQRDACSRRAAARCSARFRRRSR